MVHRKMTGASMYAQVTALRGEVGATSLEARVMESRIKYIKYRLHGGQNSLLDRMAAKYLDLKNSKWSQISR